jgi:ABC-2 type transport system permease protein
MGTDVTRLDLAGRRRSLIGYSLGMIAYTLIVVVLYPAFKDSTSLDEFVASDSTAAALFGVTGPLSSPAGWLNGNIYGNFLPLVMLLLTIGYGAAALAGQDEDGTLCLVVTLPVRRSRVALEKAATMAVQAAVLSAVVAACVLVGRAFDLTVPVGNVVSVAVAVLLLGVDFGLIAMAIGAATGRRATAIGAATALAAASYLVGSLAVVVSWLEPARYVSLFWWSVGNGQISDGVGVGGFAVLSAVGVLAAVAVVSLFERLDLH